MSRLFNIFKEHRDRPIHKWVHYLEIYERYFNSYVNKKINILEIGVQGGGSLQMWKKYFGNLATIVGIDIDENCVFSEENIFVEIGDQSDEDFLEFICNKYGPFDIIIDDGSHIQSDIIKSFYFLWDFLKIGGCYLIEDTHTAYFPQYGGGINSENNIINKFKNHLHDINSNYIKNHISELKDLDSISFYDSVIVLEKQKGKDRYTMKSTKDKNIVQLGNDFLRTFILD